MKLGVLQMVAPRVKVIRLEKMLTSIVDCGVIAADVGAAALAGVMEVCRRAVMAVRGCLDVVMSQRNRKSKSDSISGGARNSVEWKQLVGKEGKVRGRGIEAKDGRQYEVGPWC